LVLGLVAAGFPALVWAFIFLTALRKPDAFHDQGGMFVSFILTPLSMMGAFAFGIPALVMWAGSKAASYAEESGRWRAGACLSILGLILAFGTCIGPQILAAQFR